METGQHLKIEQLGEKAMGVKLEGNPKKPEPIYFRVKFPFGDVDVTRCSDNTYWVHVRINKPDDGDDPNRPFGKFIDARIDLTTKHANETNTGDFKDPNMYHMAVKVGPSN